MKWTKEQYQAYLNKQHKLPEPVSEVRLNLKMQPSKDVAGLNKTEAAFLSHLESQSHEWLGVQNITLKLADDTRYTPDFAVLCGGELTFYEVKGFFRDDAKVKLKVAARQFPMFHFVLVKRNKETKGWDMEKVNT
ncbi:MAG TPA: hypothetical protein PKJ00_03295 [Verrucomicrobiota bacterium]|nr:hypothetical protein [Verrucomicrobiota bacterium]HNS69029.1 hypothetical protein [Verrucomicrobiota bacterium]